jgi:hypothetical protein
VDRRILSSEALQLVKPHAFSCDHHAARVRIEERSSHLEPAILEELCIVRYVGLHPGLLSRIDPGGPPGTGRVDDHVTGVWWHTNPIRCVRQPTPWSRSRCLSVGNGGLMTSRFQLMYERGGPLRRVADAAPNQLPLRVIRPVDLDVDAQFVGGFTKVSFD